MCRLRELVESVESGTELRWFCCSLGLDVPEVPPVFIAGTEQLWGSFAPGLLGLAAAGGEGQFLSLGTAHHLVFCLSCRG